MRYLLDTCVISDFIKAEPVTSPESSKRHLPQSPSQQSP